MVVAHVANGETVIIDHTDDLAQRLIVVGRGVLSLVVDHGIAGVVGEGHHARFGVGNVRHLMARVIANLGDVVYGIGNLHEVAAVVLIRGRLPIEIGLAGQLIVGIAVGGGPSGGIREFRHLSFRGMAGTKDGVVREGNDA